MQVEEEFEPVNVEPVCKIYSEHNYCWETGFTLELLFFYHSKTINAKHLKGVIIFHLTTLLLLLYLLVWETRDIGKAQ